MRELKEKWISGFVSLGSEIEHNGQKIRPNTTTSIVIGKVDRIDDAGNNNLKGTIKVPGAKYDFSGFLNDNTPVANLLKEAQEKDAPICVRLERKRKKSADPTVDIQDLIKTSDIARDNIVWIIAGVYNYGVDEWILTDDAVSNPSEDPEFVEREVKSASYSTEGFFQSSAPKIKTTDLDWKANHLLSMYAYASDHSLEHCIYLNEKEIRILATFMMKACDQLQMKIKGIQTPNYNDYSHTKARGAIFSWMRKNPLSREIMDTKGGFNEWISRFLEEYTDIWNWANAEAFKE